VALYRRIIAGSTTLLVIMLMGVYSMLINHGHRNWFSSLWLVLLSALALLFAFQLVQITTRIKRIKKGQAQPESDEKK
jgi:Mn2+/Fe2+ NRAMP family transporter